MKKFTLAVLLCATVAGTALGTAACNTKPAAHTHSYTESTVDPTCTEKGYTLHKCGCGDSYTTDERPANGHTETDVEGKDADCTTDGLTDGSSSNYEFKYTLNIYSNEKDAGVFTDVGDYKFYTFNKDGKDESYLINYTGDGGEITLPSPSELKVAGKTVSSYKVNGHAFYKNKDITGVTVPDGVTEIGWRAFFGANNVTRLSLGNSVESILAEAFSGIAVSELTVPESLKYIENSAFSANAKLTTVHWNAVNCSTNYTGNSTTQKPFFNNSTNISDVTFGNKVEKLPAYLFYACGKITTLIIPASVKMFSPGIFAYCNGLTSMIFEDTSHGWITASDEEGTNVKNTITAAQIADSSIPVKMFLGKDGYVLGYTCTYWIKQS